MNPASPPPSHCTAGDTIEMIISHILPALLVASLSVKSLVGRWRVIHTKFSILLSSLSTAARYPHSTDNPLFVDLIPKILSTLRSLECLSSRCLDATLPGGKLHLQSDIDISSATLPPLHDLDILLRSGLLYNPNQHSSAIVLPLPLPSASRAELSLFIRELFARLQIGTIDLKAKALDSLLQFLSSDSQKLAPVVAEEGDITFLIRLLDPSSHSLIRDSATAVVSLLATASDASRRSLFDEGALGALLRLLDAGSLAVKEKAAAAIEAISADTSNAWAISAYGGVTILINACRPGGGSSTVQGLAAASLSHISAIDELRASMTEEDAIPVLIDLLASGPPSAWKSATLCLCSLAFFGGDEIRLSIVEGGGLRHLLQLLLDPWPSDPGLVEHALRAIHASLSHPPPLRPYQPRPRSSSICRISSVKEPPASSSPPRLSSATSYPTRTSRGPWRRAWPPLSKCSSPANLLVHKRPLLAPSSPSSPFDPIAKNSCMTRKAFLVL
ncbi:hypothetical protein HPP92_021513 [Vanilla planifolia]|uniref:ARM repeat superfamily protein n=1 Tax=Vanilla planifolia TaxID=51239 RepID=A0A835Q4Z9_VANPL|nr:hypothetical protein HPP92_021513 [Vanilla planifolia]